MTEGYFNYLCDDFDASEFGNEDDFYHCEICGEIIDDFEHKYYGGCHEDCYLESDEFADSLTLENALKKGETEKIDIDGFFAFVFWNDIKDILEAELKKLPEADQKKYIADYAKEDLTEWIERNIKNV